MIRGSRWVLWCAAAGVAALLLACVGAPCGAMPQSANRWFIGDIHEHEDFSRPVTEHAAIVQKAGYDFICLQYKHMDDPRRVPDPRTLSSRTFLVIPGSEQDFGSSRGLRDHFGFMPMSFPMPYEVTHPLNIAQGLAEAESRSPGCLKFIHHPSDKRWTLDDIRAAYDGGSRFIELNGWSLGTQFSVDLWDQALSAGMLLYGTMSTDAHTLAGLHTEGYIRLRAPRLTQKCVLAALQAGDFVACEEKCKAVVSDVVRHAGKRGEKYQVVGDNIAEVRFIGAEGKRLKTTRGNRATYVITGSEGCVRAEVVDAAGLRCFAQPVMVSP